MITELEQNFLYCCPDCTSVSIKKVNAFMLSGKEPYKLCCSVKNCKQEPVTLRSKKNGYEITVDCPICGDIHSFNISGKTMWSKDFLILNCQYSGFGILFIGKDRVRLKMEYAAQNELIAGFLAENDEDFEGYDIMFDLLELLNEFVIRHSIKCKCGSSNIKLKIGIGCIELVCLSCGNKKVLTANADTLAELEDQGDILLD